MSLATLKMPQLGESVTEGTVDRWLKQEGDMVRRDEPIVEVVTDKVNAEIPSPFEGRLVRIQVASGETVPIGAALAELEVDAAAGPSEAAKPVVRDQPAAPAPAHGRAVRSDRERVSPAVRRQIAEHMIRSVSTAPHAWSLREVDVTRLVEYRAAHKEAFEATHGFPLSYVPFFIQIVCGALMKNPYLNSTWTDEAIVLKHYVNMGVAVALPDSLIVPVIKDADLMGFTDLAHAVNGLATRA